jgi:predicted O-methyltransferase YrrM
MKFKNKHCDGQSLVPVINMLLGDVVVGVELGVFRGYTFCCLLQSCPSIYTLYGVDSYQPYTDYIIEPPYTISKDKIEEVKQAALSNIQSLAPSLQTKAVMLNEDSNIALQRFEDNSLDFIFVDTYMTEHQASNDLVSWYPKVKEGGLFAGHDWSTPSVKRAVRLFRTAHSITNKMSTFDDTWMWIK